MPYRSKCVKCDRQAALKWTIYNGQIAVVAPLCMEHGSPLSELVAIIGPRPNMHTNAIPIQAARLPKARPLDWTPPEEA